MVVLCCGTGVLVLKDDLEQPFRLEVSYGVKRYLPCLKSTNGEQCGPPSPLAMIGVECFSVWAPLAALIIWCKGAPVGRLSSAIDASSIGKMLFATQFSALIGQGFVALGGWYLVFGSNFWEQVSIGGLLLGQFKLWHREEERVGASGCCGGDGLCLLRRCASCC